MRFLGKEEVLETHARLRARFSGPPGVRDEGLLEFALLAAVNRVHHEGADLAVCAATYAYHPVRNHPFVDGNKRVGAAVAELFLRLNGARLDAPDEESVDLILGIAAGHLSR